MNLNEKCLLQFLNNPERMDSTLEKLKKYIFSVNSENNESKNIMPILNPNFTRPAR